MSHIEVDQVEVGKHFKLRAEGVKLDIHAGPNYIGLWLGGLSQAENTLGFYMQKGGAPYIQMWAPKELGFKLPFAFGGNGLQIPQTNGGAVIIPLEDLSKMAAAWQAGRNEGISPYAPLERT